MHQGFAKRGRVFGLSRTAQRANAEGKGISAEISSGGPGWHIQGTAEEVPTRPPKK